MPHSTLHRLILAGLALSPLCSAQNYSSVPAGHLTTEADRYSLYFGSRANMRCQILNNEHRTKVRQFSEVAARLDGRRSSSQFPGRSWANVKLTMGEGSYAGASRVFATNLAANTKVVFNSKMTWPSTTGTSPSPSPWGIEVKFPFSSNWLYTGVQDLVMDFTFTGGTLANNAAWSSYSFYYLDGVYASTSVGGGSVNTGTNNCQNAPHTSGPFCVPVFRTHAKNTGNPTTSDKFEFNWWLYRYPPSTPTAFALSFSGSTTGVDIGNPCNRFYLGAGPLLILTATTPSSNTGSFMFPSPRLYAPYNVAAVGARIYTQAAYTHPTRNRFELTRAGYTTIARQPVPLPGTQWLWSSSATASSGGSINQQYIPVLRLTH